MLLVLGYVLGVSKTIALYQENKQLASLVSVGEEQLVRSIGRLSEEKQRIDSLKQFYSGDDSDAFLLQLLVKKADYYQLDVIAVNEETQRTGLIFVYTLEGKYRNMIRFLKDIEVSIHSMNVVSVAYQRMEDRRTKTVSLNMKLYFNKHNL